MMMLKCFELSYRENLEKLGLIVLFNMECIVFIRYCAVGVVNVVVFCANNCIII